MPIPDYETLMLPLLELAAARKGQEVAVSTAVTELADRFKLTEDERRELLPSGGTFKFNSRVNWARTYLQKACLLEAPRRGHTRITPRGAELLKKKLARIDGKVLVQYPEFREFQGKGKGEAKKEVPSPEKLLTPREAIETHARDLRDALAAELLDRVKKSSPAFFERLVLRLLVEPWLP